ncbi:ABC transporter ATP-binding protein [Deinococcus humi]|uniref:ABC-2 type transport system ATP-binding protein n=1 Tax=Deinococcus humi TaxID=662880 RepID=A0A7W8NC44_9DEIO|nr:ABC transporter ATP-binding protein [Deinococcus humi]MBB5361799.1 ABC-2 type transport system ATP-binding protein [Deinococcus humi]
MSDLVISTSQLTRRFGATTAVDHLDLNVHRGEIYGLLGHNGAGKTTTVRLLNGVLRPDEGTIRVLGLDPVHQADAIRQRTGVLTETPSLEDRLTATENLELYADLYSVPIPAVQARIHSMLTTFDLLDARHGRVGNFSKGMKQRLALARALLHDPELLFLDEPTSGLDPVSARSVNATITRLVREEGRTVVLCTHDLADAQQLCDRVSILRHGQVVASGSQEQLIAHLGLRRRLTLEVARGEARRANTLIQTHFGTARAVQGDRIELEQVRREDIPRLLALLHEESIDVFAVIPHLPTLEDVYFRLHDGRTPAVTA